MPTFFRHREPYCSIALAEMSGLYNNPNKNPYEDVNPDQIRQSNFKLRNIHNTEKKLTRFQIYPETELACKYNKPLYKTQYSEILVVYEQGFDMNTGKFIINPMATHYSTTDENSYIPVNLLKTQETLIEK